MNESLQSIDQLLAQQSTLQAYIRTDECIGCTKCIQACPVDAIVGAAKQLHVVLTAECIGCELCRAPCPVDCIDMLKQSTLTYAPDKARARFTAKQARQQAAQGNTKNTVGTSEEQANLARKKAYIQAAVNRVKKKKLPGMQGV